MERLPGSSNNVMLKERAVGKTSELPEDTRFQQGLRNEKTERKQVRFRGSDLSCHRLDAHKGRGRNRKIRGAESSADYLAFGWLENLVYGKKSLNQREGPLLSQ